MVSFVDVFDDVTKLGRKIPTTDYAEHGTYPIIDQGQDEIAGYTDETEGLFEDVPAIIFGDHTRVIKYVDKPCFLGADGVKLLKAKLPDANYRYLYYVLQNARIPNTGYNRHFKWLKEVKIPLPDTHTQSTIVETLDKLTALISLRKQQIAKLDELVKARFVEMFDGIHDSTKYPYVTIDSFTSVMSGGTPDRGIPEYWTSGTIRWVKTTELQNCVIHDTEEHITQEGLDNSSAKLIPAGSILIAMYGQGKTRGMTGFLAVESTTNQACACILPSSAVNQTYLWQYMILSYDKLRDMAKGGNQPNLNAGIIKAFPVLMPPMELQNQFAAFVAQTDQQKLTIQHSLDKMETLKKALMQKYFG